MFEEFMVPPSSGSSPEADLTRFQGLQELEDGTTSEVPESFETATAGTARAPRLPGDTAATRTSTM